MQQPGPMAQVREHTLIWSAESAAYMTRLKAFGESILKKTITFRTFSALLIAASPTRPAGPGYYI